jgi:hypothetical protein
MYDNLGADTNEWVEVYNNTALPVDLKDLKFTEGSSNHNLMLVNGNLVLAKDSYAVIAHSAVLFMSAYPSFNGTLFDSSFTLSNKGETLQLKDAKGDVKDTVTYVSSKGAQGDGNSLQLIDTVFIASVPSPGMRNIVNNSKLALTNVPPKKVAVVPKKKKASVEVKQIIPKKEIQVASAQSIVGNGNQSYEKKETELDSNLFVVEKQEGAWLKIKKFFTKLF